jgi:hypothetical protein
MQQNKKCSTVDKHHPYPEDVSATRLSQKGTQTVSVCTLLHKT